MATFYGWGSTASRLQPLRGGSLLLTIQFPEIPGTLLNSPTKILLLRFYLSVLKTSEQALEVIKAQGET